MTTNYATNTRTALVTYFGFNANNVQNKDSYTNATWIDMLKTEINAERPIYYSGYNNSEGYGHAWVIDGYSTSDLFHCNWGWSGSYNGWYSLSALNPSSYSLNDGQSAILNVYPKLDACSDLTGSTEICSTNSAYSITIPSSASVIWSKTGNLTQVGGNTGTTYTVFATNTQNGAGSITSTIYNSHNQVFMTRTKDIWVGAPTAPTSILNFSNGDILGNYSVYDFALDYNLNQGVNQFNWVVSGGTILSGQGTNSIEIRTVKRPKGAPNYVFNVNVKVGNSCGWSNDLFVTGYVTSGSIGPALMSLSPNPSSNQVEVSLTDNIASTTLTTAQNIETATSYLVTIVDSYGSTVYSEIKKEKKFNIQTLSFRNGIYSIMVSDGINVYQNKLIVNH